MTNLHLVPEELFAGFSALFGLFKTIAYVKEGELGVRLRFGRAQRDKNNLPKIIHPGFVMLIPWVDHLEKHHVRQQTIRFDNQQVMTKGGLIFRVNAAMIFRVTDVYRALFEIDDLRDSVSDICMGLLRDILAERHYEQFSPAAGISALLLHQLHEKSEQWGVEFLQFNIIECAPTPETAQVIIAKAGVMIKVQALTEMADKLGIPIERLNPTLAAVLVGVPLVATPASRAPDDGHASAHDVE